MAKVTEAQGRALSLISGGHYRYHARSGGARHYHHVPGRTPPIYRQTLYVLLEAGLVQYSPLYGVVLELTNEGREALVARRKQQARS